MGITNIYRTIENLPNVCKKTFLDNYRGQALAFDTNALMYRYLYSGQKYAHIVQLGHLVGDLMEHDIKGVFVFDGKAPKQKAAVKEEREKRKRENLKKVENIKEQVLCKKQKMEERGIDMTEVSPSNLGDDQLASDLEELKKLQQELEKVKKSTVHVSGEQLEEAKTLLRTLGQVVIQAHSEGEATCAVMNKLGQVYAVVAEDADVIAFGGVRLIRGLGGYGKNGKGEKRRDENMTEYYIPNILQGLGMTAKEFIEVSILCKCDFTSKIADIGPVKALNAIRTHKTIENFIQNEWLNPRPKKKGKVTLSSEQVRQENLAKIPSDFDPEGARSVFYEYLDRTVPYTYTLNHQVSPYSHVNLCSFLKTKMGQWQELAVPWTERILGVFPGYHSEDQLFDSSFHKSGLEPKIVIDNSFLITCPYQNQPNNSAPKLDPQSENNSDEDVFNIDKTLLKTFPKVQSPKVQSPKTDSPKVLSPQTPVPKFTPPIAYGVSKKYKTRTSPTKTRVSNSQTSLQPNLHPEESFPSDLIALAKEIAGPDVSIIGVTGFKGSGKSTVCDHLENSHNFTQFSFAEPLKRACQHVFNFSEEQLFGSQKEKVDDRWGVTPRSILQLVGTNLFRNHLGELCSIDSKNIWLRNMAFRIKDHVLKNRTLGRFSMVCVSDVRFGNESLLIALLGGFCIRVNRTCVIPQPGDPIHASEAEIPILPVEMDLPNETDIPSLYSLVDEFLDKN